MLRRPPSSPHAKALAPYTTSLRTPAAPHGSRYYVFKTKYLDYGPRLDDPFVIARTADFGGRSAKVKKAVEQFKADGEFAAREGAARGHEIFVN